MSVFRLHSCNSPCKHHILSGYGVGSGVGAKKDLTPHSAGTERAVEGSATALLGGGKISIGFNLSLTGRRAGELRTQRRRNCAALRIESLDAAQPFDYESIQTKRMEDQNRLKVGVVGFGNFGQFLARRMVSQGHRVLAFSRTDYSAIAKSMGVEFYRDPDDFCEEHPEIVVLCTSILSTEKVLSSLPVQRLKRSTLFVDVLSVKEFPRKLFLQHLPKEFDLLCAHPMFGPESGKGSWDGLPFVFDKVRIGAGGSRESRCDRFLDIFSREGCRMVEMSCEEHDKYAAGSQFITHTVGRVLGKLSLQSTPINTKGYETLLALVDNTAGDSFDLYYGLFMYNVNATEELERLERAFDAVKKQLFDRLHNILRSQLFDSTGSPIGQALPVSFRDKATDASAPQVGAVEQTPEVSGAREDKFERLERPEALALIPQTSTDAGAVTTEDSGPEQQALASATDGTREKVAKRLRQER